METKSANQLIIDPHSVKKEYFKDLFRYRELFYFLAWRDIVVRYKETVLGVVWAVIRPLLTMAVFILVFGKIANLAAGQTHYPLFVLSALLPWLLFSGSLVDTSVSLIHSAPMISKIYFPRIVLPASDIIVHLVDFFFGLVILLLFALFSSSLSPLTLLALPIFILLTLLLCMGCGLWLSAASVRYRDFGFIVPFIVQFGVFLSPVGYSSFLLSDKVQWIYFLNPMAGIIEGFRWSLFGTYHTALPFAILLSCIVNSLILVSGFYYFRRIERICADII